MGKEVSDFDVMKIMASGSMDIASSNEVLELKYLKKKGTEVTIGIGGERVNPIGKGTHIAVLYVLDYTQFSKVKKELESKL